MQNIKIELVKYGWFEMRFGGHIIDCSSYLGNDTPRKLLESVYNLLIKKTESEWICWDDEPGASIMNLELSADKMVITVHSALLPAYNLLQSSRAMEENCGEQKWSEKMLLSQFLDELVTEFSLYKEGIGASIYEKNWMQFPEKELIALKSYAAQLSKNMGKYEKLFCTTY